MDKTWYEVAEKEGSEVEYHHYPMYAVYMAVAEQQKRAADAQERTANALEEILIKYVGAQVTPKQQTIEQAAPRLYAATTPDLGARFAFHADDYHDAYRKMAGWNKYHDQDYSIIEKEITEGELITLRISVHDEYFEEF